MNYMEVTVAPIPNCKKDSYINLPPPPPQQVDG